MRAWFLAVTVAVLALLAGAEPPEQTFEAYSFDAAGLRAAEAMVRAIVGDEGNVVADEEGGRLLVVTTKENHARVAEIVRKLTPVPHNVQIDVQFRGGSSSRSSGASLEGGAEIERSEGLTHTTIRVKPRIENTTAGTSLGVTQTLLVASGREGYIRVGESVPYLEWLMDYGLQWGIVRGRVNWQDVGSLLVVEPTVVGDGPMVRIRVTPELSGLVDGKPYHTRFAQMATEIVAQDGQTFQIGAVDQHSEFYSRFLIGGFRGAAGEQMDIFLTPRIMRATGP